MEYLAGLVRDWAGAAVDLVFPPLCPVCREAAGPDRRPPLCGSCWRAVVRFRPPWCAVCGRPYWTFDGAAAPPGGAAQSACGGCRRQHPAFTWARSASPYDGVVREAVHALKFTGCTALARPLGDLVLEVCGADLPTAVDLVVPVPLHRARERERGFNQASLIARRVARGLGVPLGERALRRARPTPAQADLTAAERRANVRGAFAVGDAAGLRGRHAALVDDVLTTGATVTECARAMRAGGAASVGVLTVARVP